MLYQNIQGNGVTALGEKQAKMLPQLVVVKMAREKERVRREVEAIEETHRRGGEVTTLHVGSWVLRSQHTEEPETSFMVLRAIFGPTLAQFGEGSKQFKSGGIPDWFVAHICIGLVDAVEFLHAQDMVHGNIEASNVMLSLYPVYMHHRYRGYPDVQLIGFSACASTAEKNEVLDVQSVLAVVEEVITKWSDVASDFSSTGSDLSYGREGQDLRALLLAQIKSATGAAAEGSLDVQYLRNALLGTAQDMRHEGPETIPRDMMRLLHADLATAAELERVMRDPVVIRFMARKEGLRSIVEDVPFIMDGMNAGMKTQRILVVRFRSKKLEFLRAMGEEDAEGETDDEMIDDSLMQARLLGDWMCGEEDAEGETDDEIIGMRGEEDAEGETDDEMFDASLMQARLLGDGMRD